ncbi:MAG: hypothetical protein Q8P67_26265 [archaeon]|nr:hypothetical protein [archaeon]
MAAILGLVLTGNLLLVKKSRAKEKSVRQWQQGLSLLTAPQYKDTMLLERELLDTMSAGPSSIVFRPSEPALLGEDTLVLDASRFHPAFVAYARSIVSSIGPQGVYASSLWVRSPTDRWSWSKRYVRLYPGLLVVTSGSRHRSRVVQALVVLFRATLRQRGDLLRVADFRQHKKTHAFEIAHHHRDAESPSCDPPALCQFLLPGGALFTSSELVLSSSQEQQTNEWLIWLRSAILCAPRALDMDAIVPDPSPVLSSFSPALLLESPAAPGKASIHDALARELMKRRPETAPLQHEEVPPESSEFVDISFDSDVDDLPSDPDDLLHEARLLRHEDDEEGDDPLAATAALRLRSFSVTAPNSGGGSMAGLGSASTSVTGGILSGNANAGTGVTQSLSSAAVQAALFDCDSAILMQGVVSVRNSLKKWIDRWVELRPGVLVYRKKSIRASGTMGIVLLSGCQIVPRVSRTSTNSLLLYNPDRLNIYSTKDFDGGGIRFSTLPGSKSEFIFKTRDEPERDSWMNAIASVSRTPPSALSAKPIRKLYQTAGRLPADLPPSSSSSATASRPVIIDPMDSVATPAFASGASAPSAGGGGNAGRGSIGPAGAAGGEGLGSAAAQDAATSGSGEDFVPVRGGDNDDLYWDGPVHVLSDNGKFLSKFLVLKPGIIILFKNEKSTDCQGMVDLHNCHVRALSSQDRSSNATDLPMLLALQADASPEGKSHGVLIEHKEGSSVFLMLPDFKDRELRKGEAAAGASEAAKPEAKPAESGKSSKSDAHDFLSSRVSSKLFFKVGSDVADWVRVLERAIAIPESEFPIRFPILTSLPTLASAPVESCEWFNLFMNKFFVEMRANDVFLHGIRSKLQYRFNKIKKPRFVGPISIDEIDIGTEMGQIRRVSFARPSAATAKELGSTNELMGQALVEYRGGASVKVSFEFYVNWPRPKSVIIPVSAWLRVEHISGEMRLFASREVPCRLSLAFASMPQTEFGVRLTIGANVLSIFPHMKTFLQSILRKLLWKSIVSPNQLRFSFPLPGQKLQLRQHKMTSKRSASRRQAEKAAVEAISKSLSMLTTT